MHNKRLLFFVFLVFWVISYAFYFKTAGAGFVTDQVGWLLNYKSLGWNGLLTAFGDQSLHYGYHLIAFLLWKICGLNGYAWMVVFTTIHSAIAALSFAIFGRLFSAAEITSALPVAFSGGLLFLISPYQTEVIVWYACIHYLVCSLLLLMAFYFVLSYLQKRKKSRLVCFYVCFIISLFTIEISFAFPVFLLLFFLLSPETGLHGNRPISLIIIFVVPGLILLAIYFLLSKIILGSVVGHYGANTHLNFSIPLLLGNLSKYSSKIFFLTQFLPYEKRNWLYLIFENEKFGCSLFAVLIIIGVAGLFYKDKLSSSLRVLFVLFAFFVAALLPILNLYFSYLVNIEGDRFTYFASIFAYQFLILVIILFFRNFGWVVICVLLFLNTRFLRRNIDSWEGSGIVNRLLVANGNSFPLEKIYLLNVPDNFGGAYLYRSHSGISAFARTLFLKTGKDIGKNVEEILHYNMNSISDSVIVEKVSHNQLRITFAQWGNWWWTEGIGAADYSTADYEVKIDKWSHSYILKFKNKSPKAICLYQSGGEWRVIKGL